VVLQQASVIGRVFWDKALAYLNQPGEAGLQPDEVERMLSALRTKEMVFQRDFSAFTGVGEHIFKHSLLREVTYESVLKRLRRLYHGLAADWLLAQGGQRARELNGIIANHLEMAGRNSDALAFLTRAGEEAQASYANREAIEYYSHALALVPRSEVELRSDLLLRREELYNRLGEREAEKNDLHALNQLLAEFPVGSEATFVAELKVKIAFRLANYDFLVSNYELAEQEAEEAAALAQALGAPAMAIKCYSILAVIANHQSKYEIALQRAQEGLALARESGDREGISRMLNILGTIAMEQADLSAGRAFLEESLSILDASSDRRYVINTRGNLAMLAGMAGDFSAALAEYQAVTSLNREVGDRAGEANSSGNLAWVYGLIGDYHSAYQYARLHRQICIEINRILEEIVALVNMSSFARLLGDLPAARQHAENGVELSLKLQSPYWHAWSLTVLGHVLCEQGEPGEAGQVYQQALAIRRQLNQPSLALEPLAGLARVALAQANLAEAMAHCEEILAYLEQGGTLDGADEPLRVLLTAVQALQAAGDRRAAATLDQAHTRLVDQAARIRDEPSRKSYLENVPWHNEILRLWQADQDSPQGD
jgi:tetratricopeptide (TPR) repeat protein